MNILEKLKELVNVIESEPSEGETKTPEEAEEAVEEEVLSESPPQESEEEELKEEPTLPDYLECEEAESLVVYEKLSQIQNKKTAMGDLVVEYESKKSKILSSIVETRKELLAMIESLRLEHGLPREGFQVKLPSNPREKVTFSKKE